MKYCNYFIKKYEIDFIQHNYLLIQSITEFKNKISAKMGSFAFYEKQIQRIIPAIPDHLQIMSGRIVLIKIIKNSSDQKSAKRALYPDKLLLQGLFRIV